MSNIEEKLSQQARNPAAPRGLGFLAGGAAAQGDGTGTGIFENKNFTRYYDIASDGGTALSVAKNWYGGANPDGTNSGWDSAWMKNAYRQYDQQIVAVDDKSGVTDFYNWFDRSDATGVVTWNDAEKGLKAGDVFNNGEKVGNVREDFDEATANVMMSEFMLDADTKAHIFARPDRDAYLAAEIDELIEGNSTNAKSTLSQADFMQDVKGRQRELLEGHGDTAIAGVAGVAGAGIAASTVSAMAAGGMLGSVVPGAGTLVGAAVAGAAAFAGAAWLNRDQLTEMTARAQETSSRANEQFGWAQGLSQGAQEFGGVGTQLINPLQNLNRGVLDDVYGERGDGTSSFYEFDEDGNRRVSGALRALDLAAALGDSVVQFSNPVGVALYLGSAGTHTVGKVGMMTTTGGAWNDRVADFDDYEGAGEWGAAVGAVVIDAAQLGMAGALAGVSAQARTMRAQVAPAAAQTSPSRISTSWSKTMEGIRGRTSALRPWEAKHAAESTQILNGIKFAFKDGKAVAARPTMQLLAPSEFLRWIPTAARARNRALLSGNAAGASRSTTWSTSTVAGPDDYFNAARELGTDSTFRNAILNGWLEGTEEGVQAILEPASFGERATFGEIAEATMYGAASGAGMSIGAMLARPSTAKQAEWRHKAIFKMMTGEGYSEEGWQEYFDSLSPDEKRRGPQMTEELAQELLGVYQVAETAQSIDRTERSVIGTMAWRDSAKSRLSKDLSRSQLGLDDSLQITGRSTTATLGGERIPTNAGSVSLQRLMLMVRGHRESIRLMVRELRDNVEALEAVDVATLSPEELQNHEAELQRARDEVANHPALDQVSEVITTRLEELYQEYVDAGTDRDAAIGKLDEINDFIRDAFLGQLQDENGAPYDPKLQEMARRAVEVTIQRPPQIEGGSFLLIRPYASIDMTENGQHGSIGMHQSRLKAMGADRDGDTSTSQMFVLVDDQTREFMRKGRYYLISSKKEITDSDGSKRNVNWYELNMDALDDEVTLMDKVLDASRTSVDDARHRAVQHTIDELSELVWERYENTLPEDPLLDAILEFQDAFLLGSASARLDLIETLVNIDPEAFLNRGLGEQDTEITWLTNEITTYMNALQRDIAANHPDYDFTDSMMEDPLPEEQAWERGRAVLDAVTPGQMQAFVTPGTGAVREAQQMWYTIYRQAVALNRGDMTTEQFDEAVQTFLELTAGIDESAIGSVYAGANPVQARALGWLERMHEQGRRELGSSAPGLAVLANTMVRDVQFSEDGWIVGDGQISLIQMLLRKSVDSERIKHRVELKQEPDGDLARQLRRLDRLSQRDPEGHSATATLAFVEVLGSKQMWELIGDAAKYLGRGTTLNQFIKALEDKSRFRRQADLENLKRKAPYKASTHKGGPPYNYDTVTGNIHPYAVVVDAIQTAVSNESVRKRRSNETAVEELENSFKEIGNAIQSYRQLHKQRLDNLEDATILDELLRDSSFAQRIADAIPEASRQGAFQRLPDNQVYAAHWVKEMLLATPAKAAVTYIVHTKLAEWNAMGGEVSHDGKVGKRMDPDTGEQMAPAHPREYKRIKSRFLQLMASLAQEGTVMGHLELDRFVKMLTEVNSVDELQDKINGDPRWRGDRAEWLALHDDVAEYEADPSEIWSANLPGAIQREAISALRSKAAMMSQSLDQSQKNYVLDQPTIARMQEWRKRKENRANGKENFEKLELRLANAKLNPDLIGPRARDSMMQLVQDGVARMQDKGKADPRAAGFGEHLVSADSFGIKQSTFATVDALTAYDVEEILSNVSKLVEGPVRIGLQDGSVVVVDLSTADSVLDALSDPRTYPLAMTVLGTGMRDTSAVTGELQTYNVNPLSKRRDVRSEGTLQQVLNASDYSHLFWPWDSKPSIQQAFEGVSTLEARIRAKAHHMGPDSQKKAYFAVSRIVNEFIIAATSTIGYKSQDKEMLRQSIMRDVFQTVMELGAYTRLDPDGTMLQELKEDISLKLREKYLGKRDEIARALRDPIGKKVAKAIQIDSFFAVYTAEANRLEMLIADTTLPDNERDAAVTAREVLQQRMDAHANKIEDLSSDPIVESALKMFEISGDPAKAAVDNTTKANIFSFLGAQNRFSKFTLDYVLVDKAKAAIASDPLNVATETLTHEDWVALSEMASTVFLAEMGGMSGSSSKLTKLVLGDVGTDIRGYYDPTWAGMLDKLFDKELLLSTAHELGAGYNWNPPLEKKALANKIYSRLFNDKRVGDWTELNVSENLKANEILANAAVGLAIPTGGILSDDLAAYTGAMERTYDIPPADSVTTITIPTDTGVLTLPDDAFLRLDHHFFQKAVIVGTSVNGPETIDLLDLVGQLWHGEESVRDSGIRWMDLGEMSAKIDEVAENLVGDFELQLEYYDTDRRPVTPDGKADIRYTNNIFFDGIGRDHALGTTPTLLGEFVASVGALKKVVMQNPMDMATKEGKGFTHTVTTPLSAAQKAEARGTLREILEEKVAQHIRKPHDFGDFLPGDANTLYKFEKMRHIVRGQDENGNIVRLWAQDVLAMEAAEGVSFKDRNFSIKNARLVPLSDRQARSLLGEPGFRGMPGAIPRPRLGLIRQTTLPPLTDELLERVGLERLGEFSILKNAKELHVLEPSSHSGNSKRESGDVQPYEIRPTRWNSQQHEIRTRRMEFADKGKSKMDLGRINSRAAKQMRDMLGTEGLARVMSRIGIPWTEVKDLGEVELTKHLMSQIEELAQSNPTSVIFTYDLLAKDPDPASGILTPASISANFGKELALHPTYKDSVILDLKQFEAHTSGDLDAALDLLKKTFKTFADRGVSVILGHADGNSTLRADLVDYVNEGPDNYMSSRESAHILVPVEDKYLRNDTRKALSSTLTASRVFSGRNVYFEHVSDVYSLWGANENTNIRNFGDDFPIWQGAGNTIIPSALQYEGVMYNLPVRSGVESAEEFTTVQTRLVGMLSSKAGRKFIKQQLGGDPKNVQVQRILDSGEVEPGVLGVEAAMDKLLGQLNGNRLPTDLGEDIQLGSLTVTVGQDGSILLGRLGFDFPGVDAWNKQRQKVFDPGTGVAEPVRIIGATNKLSTSWTIRPPSKIVSIEPDPQKGLVALSEWDLNQQSKFLAEGDAFKSMGLAMPTDVEPPGNLAANGARVAFLANAKAMNSKQALSNTSQDLKTAVLTTGISFKPELIETILGEKPTTPDEIAIAWAKVVPYLQAVQEADFGFTADDIARLLSSGDILALAGQQLNSVLRRAGLESPFQNLDNPFRELAPAERISMTLMAALMAPGVRWTEVVESSGILTLSDISGGAQVRELMDLVSDSLSDLADTELHQYLLDKLNQRFKNYPDFRFINGFQFMVRYKDKNTGEYFPVPGRLKLTLGYPMEENDVNYTYSGLRREKQGASTYNSLIAAMSLGADTLAPYMGNNLESFFDDTGITRFHENGDGGFRDLLRAVPKVDTSYKPWKRASSAGNLYRKLQHAKVVSYLEEIDTEGDGWSADGRDKAKLDDKVKEILRVLNLDSEPGWESEIHYAIRQLFGAPAQREGEPDYVGNLSPSQAYQGATLVLENVKSGRIPSYGGMVPLIHESFYRAIFDANLNAKNPWAPRTGNKRDQRAKSDYGDWVNSAFGQLRESPEAIRTAFRGDLDGFMHTFQTGVDDITGGLYSLDDVVNAKLTHPEITQYVDSLDPNQEAILNNPPLFETMKLTLDSMLANEGDISWMGAHSNPSTALSDNITRVEAWLSKKQLPKDMPVSMNSYLEEGSRYLSSKKEVHTFFTGLVNLSVMMRVANPALWVSAVIENSFKVGLDNMTDILMGRGTGAIGRTAAALAEMGGYSPRFSPEQIRRIHSVADRLGSDTAWGAEIMQEITFDQLVETGSGSISKKLEKGATWAARMFSEPAQGMTAKSRAKRYLMSAIEYLDATDNSYSFDALMARLDRDPLYLKKQFPERGMNPHKAGINAVSHSRNMKANVISKVTMGSLEAMAGSSKFGVNAAATMLKIPFLFTRFNSNMLMTMTGSTGVDQVAAMWLDGRESKFVGRWNAWLRNEQYVEGTSEPLDMSDVLLGADLSRPFLQGAVTHTVLMAAGLMAGSLGLSGEDEEMRRRRRLTQQKNLPLYYDPRRVENDFLYADAIFLDNMPGPLQSMFSGTRDEVTGETRSYMRPHWIINQFLSPVMGMERFLSTGDTRHVKWGFQNAFSMIPTSVTRVWDEASLTADLMLQQNAQEAGALGTTENNAQFSHTMLTVAGIYERALLESTFVNGLRSGSDRYDRDPWTMPARDPETGDYILDQGLDGDVQAPAASKDLTTFTDEDGNVRQGYESRELGGMTGARAHQLAENNLTFAVMASLFTGQWGTDSSFLRRNMVVKTRDVALAPIEQAEAEALILAAWQGMSAEERLPQELTVDEISRGLKAEAQAAGQWWDGDEILQRAKEIHASQGDGFGALSLVRDNQEYLTTDGARAIIKGLAQGSVKLGDSSLQGVFIDTKTRQKLQEEIFEDLVIEGMELGLPEETARYRASRIWYGNNQDEPGAIGLRNIVWSNSIPSKPVASYNQLNATYMTGPDGMPWATPFGRDDWIRTLGIPLPAKNLISEQAGLDVDIRGKVVDRTLGINTGLHGLERREELAEFEIPELDMNAKIDTEAASKRNGWTNYGRRGGGYSRSGYSGGGSGYTYSEFVPMRAQHRGNIPYAHSLQNINVNNPHIRRSNIRRERVWSDRGRLKQWQ